MNTGKVLSSEILNEEDHIPRTSDKPIVAIPTI